MKQLFKQLNRREWLLIALSSLVLIFLTLAPVFYGYLITPPNRVFTGLKMPDFGDYPAFFSRLEQSRQGHFFHHYLFSSENFPRVLFFPVWTMLGFFARFFSLSQAWLAFYLAQIFLIPLLVFSLYLFLGHFIAALKWRRLALITLLFASGADWLFWPWLQKFFYWTGLNLNLPDAHIFTAVFHSSHLTFLLAAILWLWLSVLELAATGKFFYAYLGGLLSGLIFLSHPFQVIPLLGVAGFYFLIQIFFKKKYWLIKKLIPFVVLNLIWGLYLFWLWYYFPVIQNWNQNNFVASRALALPASLVFLASGYSLFLIAAFFKLASLIKRRHWEKYLLLLIWLLWGVLAVHLPIPWRGKMILGWSVPLTIFGVLGLKWLLDKYPKPLFKISVWWLAIILTLPASGYLVGYHFILYYQESLKKESLYYLPQETVDALIWLRQTPEESVILASTENSLMASGYAGRKVYLGHRYETLNYQEKFAQAAAFFASGGQVDFLRANGINYLLAENGQNFNQDGLTRVYANPSITIYQVK